MNLNQLLKTGLRNYQYSYELQYSKKITNNIYTDLEQVISEITKEIKG